MPQVLKNEVPAVMNGMFNFTYSFGSDGEPVVRYDFTPFALQYIDKGVCSDQSYATASFMADALGAVSSYVPMLELDHAISVLLFPPEYRGGAVNLSKYNLTGIVVDDTYGVTPQMINEYITWNYTGDGYYVTQIFYPFADSVTDAFEPTTPQQANAFLYTGIPETLYNLPPLLQFPWLQYYIKEMNLTAIG